MMKPTELAAIVGEEWVREADASPEYVVDGLRPQWIVWPGTVEEVAAVLRRASEAGWAVVPAGYGTGLFLGNPPERVDLVIVTTRLNHILDYEPADLTASVQAGCTLAQFNQTAGQHGQWLPLDPPQPHRATLGAIAAVADYGPLRLGFGLPRDYVIGLHVVQADGRQLKTGGRVVKNVAGYDLNKLFVGSLGTLGIITQLNLKVRPRPDTEATCLLTYNDVLTLDEVVKTLAASELAPAAVELLSPQSAEWLSLPCSSACTALLVRFLDSEPAVHYQVQRLSQIAHRHQVPCQELPEKLAQPLWDSLRDLAADADIALSLRINGLPAESSFWLTKLAQLFADDRYRMRLISHYRSGVVRALIQSDLTESLGEELADKLGQLRRSCQERKAYVVIERAPSALKKRMDVWGEVGPTAKLMRALKQQFDPNRLLNPGRFVAGI